MAASHILNRFPISKSLLQKHQKQTEAKMFESTFISTEDLSSVESDCMIINTVHSPTVFFIPYVSKNAFCL
jgi:hypothetical protein